MTRTCRRLRWSVPATAILMLAATAEAQEASDHSIGHTQEPMEKPATAESLNKRRLISDILSHPSLG